VRLDDLTAAALAAATAVAGDQGLRSGEARVLSDRGNLLVHLAPSSVVARVATLTAFSRRDPFSWLAREVAVAGFAARQGGPVIPPAATGVDPGPHRQGGFAVSLWTYVPPRSGVAGARQPGPGLAGPGSAGRALGLLHLSLASFPGRLPWLAPGTDQISDGLAALEREQVLDRAQLSALRARHAEVLAGVAGVGGSAIVLHGDAHLGNLLAAGTDHGDVRWAWIDLEETCAGPREWDLAVLARGCDSADDAASALAAYAAVTGTQVPAAGELAPFTRLREVEAAVWCLCMAHQNPSRYAAVAQDLLARVLTGQGAAD
jgi:hypothetical protein